MRHLFCINPGRSGSQYLAQLLGTAEGVAAFHEPEPTMSGAPLHQINAAPYAASLADRRVKLDGIARLVAAHPNARVYAETNHMFIKTFFDVVVEALDDVEVIHLRRDPALVLKSFVELGYFSPLNHAWPDWMSSPNAATAAQRCVDADAKLDPFDLSIAYLFDIAARAARFRRDHPAVPVHEVNLGEILDAAGARSFLQRLRLTPTSRTNEVAGVVVNARAHKKARFANPTEVETCRLRLAAYAARAAALGVALTPL
jgi:hypothetical protein